MSGERRVAALIPAYQAAPTVADIALRARAQLAEVLVVDDGSTDGTGDAARAAGIETLALPRNMGKGTALKTGFKVLFDRGCEAVVTVDADGQHLPEEIPALLRAFEADPADLVLGTRDSLFAQMSRLRRCSNRASSWAISRVAGERMADVQTGFRLYARRLIEATGFPAGRFEAESAIIVRAVRGGFRVTAVPVRLGFADGRVTSHYRPLVDSLRIARAVARARLCRWPWS